MKKTLLVFAVLIGTLSCKNNSDNKAEDPTFKSTDLGWQMDIPKDWIVSYQQNPEVPVEASAKDMSVQSSYQSIDAVGAKNTSTYLLNFKKDDNNSFAAFYEPFDSTFATFDQQIRNTREMFYYSLKQQGLNLDTLWGSETIQGKAFKTFEIAASDPYGKPLFKHMYYNAVINGQLLSAIIRYDSPETKALILDKWKNSSFK